VTLGQIARDAGVGIGTLYRHFPTREALVEALYHMELADLCTCADDLLAVNAPERALDLAEPDGALLWFLLHPAPGLFERHARHGTAHASLIADILSLLAERKPAPPAGPRPPLEALTDSEIGCCATCRPTCQRRRSGASCTSRTTPSGPTSATCTPSSAHTRAEAVARARALGLLAPSPLRSKATLPG
jgi:LuxR family transcriptional regulator, maltose regulon positive regulatory protein